MSEQKKEEPKTKVEEPKKEPEFKPTQPSQEFKSDMPIYEAKPEKPKRKYTKRKARKPAASEWRPHLHDTLGIED